MQQRWLGRMQSSALLQEPTDHIGISNANGGFPYHLGMPQTSKHAWNSLRERKNLEGSASAHCINRINARQYITGLPCKSDKAQLAPVFGLHPVSEQSKGRSTEPPVGHLKPTLRSIVSPLNAHRLKPIRQKTKNAVVSILDSGEVCMEFLKEHNSQELVKEVLRISCDGSGVSSILNSNIACCWIH
uniref:Polo like kinase 4 n=1 Tax=Sphenodon punctatus TaxID=8508 RepID=A0A8D0GZ37_SPHPU